MKNSYDVYYNNVTGMEQKNNVFMDSTSRTIPCVIKKVYASKMEVDVYIPAASSNMFNIKLVTGIMSHDSFVKTIPSPGSEGLLLLSNAHSPMVITVSNILKEKEGGTYYENYELLAGETKLGNKSATVKLGSNNNIFIRSSMALDKISGCRKLSIMDLDTKVSPGLDVKVDYNEKGKFRKTTFKNITKNKSPRMKEFSKECMNEIMNYNDDVLLNLRILTDKVHIFKETALLTDEFMAENTKALIDEITTDYIDKVDGNESVLVIEEGCSDPQSDIKYKVSIKSNDTELASVSFREDGQIDVNCKKLNLKEG